MSTLTHVTGSEKEKPNGDSNTDGDAAFSLADIGGILAKAHSGDKIIDLFFGNEVYAAAFVQYLRSFAASTMQDPEDAPPELQAGHEKLPFHRTKTSVTVPSSDGGHATIPSVILRHSAQVNVDTTFDPEMTLGQLQEELQSNMRNLL